MPKNQPVFLREIKKHLEDHLYKNPENTLHWVNVVGEDSMEPKPTLSWVHSNSLLQVSIADGFSEGCLVYVHAQADRYKPDQLVALFRIKLLCSAKRAFSEARHIWEFFESSEFGELTGQT